MYHVHFEETGSVIIKKLSNKMEIYVLHYNLVIFSFFAICLLFHQHKMLCIVCLSKLDDQAESNKNKDLESSGR